MGGIDVCKTPLGGVVPQPYQEGRVLRLMTKGYSRQGAEEQEEGKPISAANDSLRQQNALQQTSQKPSCFSNLMKQAHDTCKNIINNLK